MLFSSIRASMSINNSTMCTSYSFTTFTKPFWSALDNVRLLDDVELIYFIDMRRERRIVMQVSEITEAGLTLIYVELHSVPLSWQHERAVFVVRIHFNNKIHNSSISFFILMTQVELMNPSGFSFVFHSTLTRRCQMLSNIFWEQLIWKAHESNVDTHHKKEQPLSMWQLFVMYN